MVCGAACVLCSEPHKCGEGEAWGGGRTGKGAQGSGIFHPRGWRRCLSWYFSVSGIYTGAFLSEIINSQEIKMGGGKNTPQ